MSSVPTTIADPRPMTRFFGIVNGIPEEHQRQHNRQFATDEKWHQWLIDYEGYQWVNGFGKVGQGKQVHHLRILCRDVSWNRPDDGRLTEVADVVSLCGMVRRLGAGPLDLLEGPPTCQNCLNRKGKQGKELIDDFARAAQAWGWIQECGSVIDDTTADVVFQEYEQARTSLIQYVEALEPVA